MVILNFVEITKSLVFCYLNIIYVALKILHGRNKQHINRGILFCNIEEEM